MRSAAALLALLLTLPLLAQSPLIDQGRAAMQRGDYDAAADALEKAVAATPNNAEAHYLLGGAYGRKAQTASMFSKMGLAGKAKDHLEKAVQLDPNHLDARFGLMEYYSKAPGIVGGSNEKAQQQAAEIMKRDRIMGHRAAAQLLLNDKKIDAARNEYLVSVKEQPNSPKAHYGLAIFYLSVDKNNKAATDEFETSVKIDPNYMPGWFQIGHMSAINGTNFARGEESLKKYLAYTPKQDEPPHARAHFWLGQIYEKQGNRAAAKQAYATSLRLNPGQKDVNEANSKLR
jgi:tetratricopeptide (TPR) repeat protein